MTPSDGTYSYRFSGFSMKDGNPFFIAGVGVMRLRGGKIESGRHEASLNRLKDSGGNRSEAAYEITGCWREHAAGGGLLTAEMQFTEVVKPGGPAPQVLLTEFAAVPAGQPDRFWLVSMGPVAGSLDTSELTSGEIARIGAL